MFDMYTSHQPGSVESYSLSPTYNSTYLPYSPSLPKMSIYVPSGVILKSHVFHHVTTTWCKIGGT